MPITEEERAMFKSLPPKKKKPPKPRRPAKPTIRPACETEELAKYSEAGKAYLWGQTAGMTGRWARMGVALLYNPEHPSGLVTIMPIGEDREGVVRWRPRIIKGYCPYRYERIDIEPEWALQLPDFLRKVAAAMDTYLSGQGIDNVLAVAHEQARQESHKPDTLGDKFKKLSQF